MTVSNQEQSAVVHYELDKLRYIDLADRVLARYEVVDTLFPSADELEERGADAAVILKALTEGGLDAVDFGEILEDGLDVALFSRAVAGGFDPACLADLADEYGVADLNGQLANFVEAAENADLSSFDLLAERLAELGIDL